MHSLEADVIQRRSDELLEPREPTEQWIRALGRLRDRRALTLLEPLLDGEHARTAALAIGWTPERARALRRIATQEPTGREGDLRWLALEGLGRQGTARDVRTLIAALDEGWPYDEAAARGLLRMHRREIDVSGSLALGGALGDAVNLGSRLEGLTKQYGVQLIVNETTAKAVPEFAYLELDRVRVRRRCRLYTVRRVKRELVHFDRQHFTRERKVHRTLRFRHGNGQGTVDNSSDLLAIP